jgi:hypothetical protein
MTRKPDIYQLPNGKWTHSKTACEFDDKTSAQMDFRFCCEWEGLPSTEHTESDFQ